MQHAQSLGRIAARRGLLDQAAEVNQPGYAGLTPLAAACHSGELAAARLLLVRGADPNLAEDDGETPLHQIIMWCPEELELFKLLLENGASLEVRTPDGRSLVEFCRDRRADYATPDYSGSASMLQHMLNDYDRLEDLIAGESPAPALK